MTRPPANLLLGNSDKGMFLDVVTMEANEI